MGAAHAADRFAPVGQGVYDVPGFAETLDVSADAAATSASDEVIPVAQAHDGVQGPSGEPGVQGPIGPRGPAGPKGAPGRDAKVTTQKGKQKVTCSGGHG